MKTVQFASFLFVLFAMLSSVNSSATPGIALEEANDVLKTIIIDLVKKPALEKYVVEGTTVNLKFLINEQQEIVVLSTDSRNQYFDSYLKYRLNYHKVESEEVTQGLYFLDIRFKTN